MVVVVGELIIKDIYINNMQNSTKTWQEEKIKHTAEHIGVISEGALKTLVTEIRKRDMEALIEMFNRPPVLTRLTRERLIKDYYEN